MVDQQCRESNGKVKIEGYMRVSDEQAHHHHLTYNLSMCTTISLDKDKALGFAKIAHDATKFKVYTDGSRYKGGIGVVVVLYKGDRIVRLLQFHLGPKTEHTVYESEIIGISLALYLLTLLRLQILSTIVIGLDNQATICSLNNQEHKPAHHLLDLIHTAAE